ncbi:unnamed protein product [Pseudo-nitzschia multistriata]|uniref:GDP-Man:Man(3)GlcNAc(2)-PP-Dol alpha-1,2-mannosyltransferase n=1 Tax=Pseudo-nitzschia multistriata TaxID=183589 RepID=A0A448Z2P0_9STRA|nr:unnamed protein product [Pseudo-nitzschia multistriata]
MPTTAETTALSWSASSVAAWLLAAALCWFWGLPGRRQLQRRKPGDDRPKRVVYAFFHPYASGGGGGERVLWKMVRFLQTCRSHRSLRCGSPGPSQEGSRGCQQNPTTAEAATKETTTPGNDGGSCNAGGDGTSGPDDSVEIVIYTIDPPSTDEAELRADAERRFDVRIPKKVRLVSLEDHRDCLAPRPFLSLVMESWGTMRLARWALLRTIADDESKIDNESDTEFVFCDTTGCAFTFAVVRWMSWFSHFGNRGIPPARILAYVHYPTISTDMMAWEWKKGRSQGGGAVRRLKSCTRLAYYYAFSLAYGLTGSLADLVLVNSTWTHDHIRSLWAFGRAPIEIIYPPCRVPGTVGGEAEDPRAQEEPPRRDNTIVSIGQFRPEKDHGLQIEALSVLLEAHPELREGRGVKLLLIGSCRNEADRGRVEALRSLVEERGLGDHVDFAINPPYADLRASMATASIGIHTMREEHFGIGIVEMMAAGLLTIAHDSGGPRSDIVLPLRPNGSDAATNAATATGFLATTAEEYASALHAALTMGEGEARAMRDRARRSAARFSDAAFDERLEGVLPLLYGHRC